ASAARKDFERLERFDSASNRCLVLASSRIERVSVITCAHLYTSWHKSAQRETTIHRSLCRSLHQKLAHSRRQVRCHWQMAVRLLLGNHVSQEVASGESGHLIPAGGGLVDGDPRGLRRGGEPFERIAGFFASDHQRKQTAVLLERQVDELPPGIRAFMRHD